MRARRTDSNQQAIVDALRAILGAPILFNFSSILCCNAKFPAFGLSISTNMAFVYLLGTCSIITGIMFLILGIFGRWK